ncbi:MAG: DUF3883 domain-containing protein, partial [Bacillota bacterium]
AIDRIMKAFPDRGHFLMEFVQNADDAGATVLVARIEEGQVWIMNNGREFSREDVESLCKVGRSSKKPDDYIGYLGVGFKAVFLISDAPCVYSGPYRFTFDRSRWSDPSRRPWQITPLWLQHRLPEGGSPRGHTTVFQLPVSRSADPELVSQIAAEFSSEQFSLRTLLFLRHLEEVVLQDTRTGFQRRLKKSKVSARQGGLEIHQLSEQCGERPPEHEHWVVFKRTVAVPDRVRRDWVTRAWERDQVRTREVAVAFAVDEAGQLRETGGTAHVGVFSYLPLKEVPLALPFIVQADFLTAPGRHSITRDALWNTWLVEELWTLVRDMVIPAFSADPRWKYAMASVLHPGPHGPEPFEQYLMQPLRDHLRASACLVAIDGTLVRPDEAMRVQEHVLGEGWFRARDAENIFPGLKVLDPSCRVPQPLARYTKDGPSYNSNGFNSAMDELVRAKAEQCDLDFFCSLYHEIGQYSDRTLKGRLRGERMVLTEDGELAKPSDAYWSEEGPPLLGRLHRVHPGVWKDGRAASVLVRLGVQELSPRAVRDRQVADELAEEVPRWAAKWPNLTDEERLTYTVRLLELWKGLGWLPRALIEGITVKTTDEQWLRPGNTFLPLVYEPVGQSLEKLIRAGLLDKASEWNIAFVSEDYLRLGEYAPSDWRRLFCTLGVDSRLERGEAQALVQRIGVNLAVQYEREHGRQPRELPRSEEVLGFDVESDGRLIEVKARNQSYPSVELTSQQLQQLSRAGTRYYIYVVTDALVHPVLRVLRGDALVGLMHGATFSYRDWSRVAAEEYRPTLD